MYLCKFYLFFFPFISLDKTILIEIIGTWGKHLFLLSLFFLQRHTYYFLIFNTLWANSADDKLVIVFLFFLVTGLTFHANCLQCGV